MQTDKNAPSPKASAPAAKPDSKPEMVKARVRPNGRYGPHRAGEIVEVEPNELIVCKHVLVALDKEHEEAKQAAAVVEASRTDTSIFRAGRARGLASAAMMRERAEREETEKFVSTLERLKAAGVTVGVSSK